MEKQIVEYIISKFGTGLEREHLANILCDKFGIEEDAAHWAIEMTSTGLFRAGFLYDNSPYPKNNVDDDPFLKEAIKIGTKRLTENPPKPKIPRTLDELVEDYYNKIDISMTLYELNNIQVVDNRVHKIFIDALNDPNQNNRDYAIVGIRSKKVKAAIPILKKKLESQEDDEKLQYARALWDLEEEKLALELLSELAKSSISFVRYDTALFLGETKGKEAIKILKSLRKDQTMPVEHDERGIPTKATIRSVGQQAQLSLKKISHFWERI